MSEEILPIPRIPSGLREASQRGILIPFIGAGASLIAGCPSWSKFADDALRHFVGQGKFSHGQLDQIIHLHPRVKLSIALGLQKEHESPIDFRKLLHPTGRKDNPKGRRLYGSLSSLAKTFVTTNYDEWLDEVIVLPSLSVQASPSSQTATIHSPRTVIHKIQDLTPAILNQPNTVIHLHGSVLSPDGMVLTTQDYVQHYANDRLIGSTYMENRVLTFLDHLFKNKTVLFVGYGLEELEILEYVILKARPNPGSHQREAKHYLLQGFFSHQYELMQSLKRYYIEECGIELIPYLRDRKDWDQLLDVMDEFAQQAPASDIKHLEEFIDMKDLLND